MTHTWQFQLSLLRIIRLLVFPGPFLRNRVQNTPHCTKSTFQIFLGFAQLLTSRTFLENNV